ncbi:IpaD/SipD/SspD family type III secretion system needle tip protein [Pseudomonas sp. SDO55104_S430]
MANAIGIAQVIAPLQKPVVDVNRVDEVSLLPEMLVEGVAFTHEQMIDRSMNALNRSFNMLRGCCPKVPPLIQEPEVDGWKHFSLAHSAVEEFVAQVETRRVRWQIWEQQLLKSGAVLVHCQQCLPEQSRQYVETAQTQILRDLKERHPPPAEIAEAFDQAISSSDDFFEKLLELIDLIKNGYLAGYEHIIAKYSDFFADFNKDITAKLKEWIQGANDGKEVKINAGEIRLALQALINKYSHPNPASVLFPAPGMGGATREEAEKWRQALGLPASCLKQNADGTYSVVMDLSPLTIMRDSLPPNVFWITWDTAKFQAWQTGFNAQEERMKNLLQSLTQKYSNANSYHDNFNKTLSSHLNQYADMLKAMLNF